MLKTTFFRSVMALILSVFFVSSITSSVSAGDYSKNQNILNLKKGFFSPLKYSQQEDQYKKVYSDLGLSFSGSFENTLAEYQPALRQAKNAHSLNGLALISSVAMLGFSVKMFMNTLSDVDDLNSGNCPDNSMNTGTLVGMAVSSIMSGVFSRWGNSHLQKGVWKYNEWVKAGRPADFNPGHYQPSKRTGFNIGIGKANISSDGVSSDSRGGFIFGWYIHKSWGKHVGIQPEMNINIKGYKTRAYKNQFQTISAREYKFTYLEFPLLLKIQPLDTKIKPHLILGPSLGLTMGAEVSEAGRTDELDDYNIFDAGLVYGIGITLGKTNFGLELRQSRGFTNVVDINSTGYKNRTTTFLTSYGF